MHQPLRTEELDYDLPAGLIATRPAEPRDHARMMVLRADGSIEHRQVRDLPDYLNSGDAVVFNTTAVVPARLEGEREDTGGHVQGLYLESAPADAAGERWQVMLRSGSRLQHGRRIVLWTASGERSPHVIELEAKVGAQWIVRLCSDSSTESVLAEVGRTPLPPYILRARSETAVTLSDAQDRSWYQTVYADSRRKLSVAAPTAGLHFTPELLERLRVGGAERLDVMLHVGAGTFQPVSAAVLQDHQMHREHYEISEPTYRRLHDIAANRGASPRRILAVGTTTVRTLESLPSQWSASATGTYFGETQLLIAPPYEFRLVDGLLTNFHLPRSTLLALVAAMTGLERLKEAYAEAIRLGYRFYSYGDAMLIEPQR
ncbi:MAG TPA: tRNA preQ1(34) S-adenosylmethionine ribosyltransferase-isomerase QueA [Phycisphaerales bacterium]|nr:tRNA preQ1(34) S-adenosylmethionine ribosyltransferase-isomerase QueA [Phycisphaerales bacterium]HRQ74626.1 tRNA preQ1(34) S-adenosylmethionine ribosyltransferase-isomerase QueA [Phycisphaerales bacterium]